MRGKRVARIADEGDHLALADLIANADSDTTTLKMRVERVTLAAEVKHQ